MISLLVLGILYCVVTKVEEKEKKKRKAIKEQAARESVNMSIRKSARFGGISVGQLGLVESGQEFFIKND